MLELGAAFRKYQAPMGRLVYVGHAPEGAEASARLAIDGMEATTSTSYTEWLQERDASLTI